MKKAVWIITAVVCVGKVLFAMANNAQGVLLTEYINTFQLTSGMQGLPNAAANAGMLVAMLLSVSMASRVGKLPLHVAGLGLMALMLALTGAATATFWLVAAYVVMGFAFGCIDTTASAIMADLHPGRRGPMMLGILHAAYGTGGILAPIWMTAALGAGASWRVVLWGLAAVVALAFCVSGTVVWRTRKQLPAQVTDSQRLTWAGLRAFLARPGNLLLILCAALYCAHQCSVYLWISRIIGVGYGRVALGAAALSLFWVGTVVSRLLVPLTGIGAVRYMRYGMLAAGVVQGIAFVVGGPVAACVGAALSGLIGGAALPMTLAESNARNPRQSMLAVTAVLLTTSVAAILCAPLIGFIVGATSLPAGIAVSAVFALASSLVAFRLRPIQADAA